MAFYAYREILYLMFYRYIYLDWNAISKFLFLSVLKNNYFQKEQ